MPIVFHTTRPIYITDTVFLSTINVFVVFFSETHIFSWISRDSRIQWNPVGRDGVNGRIGDKGSRGMMGQNNHAI